MEAMIVETREKLAFTRASLASSRTLRLSVSGSVRSLPASLLASWDAIKVDAIEMTFFWVSSLTGFLPVVLGLAFKSLTDFTAGILNPN
jgi:hypothetical protein